MSGVAMESATPPPGHDDPASLPAPPSADATQQAVDRALDSAQRLIAELRSARFAALARHAGETGA